VKTRLNAWKIAWNGIKEKPILGWGQENYIALYTVSQIPAFEGHVMIDRAHNILIDWIINAGLLGLFSYLLIFGYVLYCIWAIFLQKRITKPVFVTLFTALIVYFIQNLFTFDTINTYLLYFALLAYIDRFEIQHSDSDSNSKVNIVHNNKLLKTFIVTFLALLLISFLTYYINYMPIKVSRLSARISNDFPQYKSFLKLEDDFNEALSYETFGSTDIRIRMKMASTQIMKYNLFGVEGALNFIQRAAEELKKGIIENYHNLDYLSHLISFYHRIALIEPLFIVETEELIKQCIRLNPYYEEFYFRLAEVYFLKKDYERAFTIIDKAVAQDTLNDRKQLKLAEAAILVLKQDVAEEALEKVRKIRIAENTEIASGMKPVFSVNELYHIAKKYVEIRNFSKALKFYKEIIIILPDDALYHYEVAKIYLELGDKFNAKKEAERASELDPLEYSESVKKFILDFINNS
jgi:tetratricopeptide (TPR) repeat protein